MQYTEKGIDPEIDMGPLVAIVGIWSGKNGRDISPEPDGVEDNAYYETMSFRLTRRVSNAEEQKLAAVQYHQLVQRQTNDKILHDQCGYWAWDAATNTLMHVFSIPRGVTVVAGGTATQNDRGDWLFEVRAAAGDVKWNISEAPFMQKKARTRSFTQSLRLGKNSLSYRQSSILDIYGREFEHTEENVLTRQSSE